jgi:hypothetical protein
MTMGRILSLACMGLALALVPAPSARAETCTADSFGDAVDASAAELRAFSAETQPKLKAKLQALRDHKKWTDTDYETKGLKLVHDAKLDAFDAEAGELLSKIDTLGSPESVDGTGTLDCSSLAELKAASSELMAVMRAKSAYLIAKIDREIGTTQVAATPADVAKAEPQHTTPPAETAKQPSHDDVTEALSPLRRGETPKKDAAPPPSQAPPAAAAPPPTARAEPPQPTSPPPEPPPAKTPPEPDAADKEADRASSWSTTTAQAVIPPPPMPRGEPNYDAPPPGAPYELPPPGEEGEDGTAFDAEGGGYTIDEIREATRGFFGTVSTSLASVIEHAFQKAGRPTAYVLGNEGGGAFLAGLRYGEGTLYLRNGGSQKVYWHGPSLGYDLGAEGSRTLFLIYDLHEPNTLFRRFTGVDGSAYLVGGVGMTLLKGGPVTMAPIRSGIGLRLGASIGYVRFSPRPTWNPF